MSSQGMQSSPLFRKRRKNAPIAASTAIPIKINSFIALALRLLDVQCLRRYGAGLPPNLRVLFLAQPDRPGGDLDEFVVINICYAIFQAHVKWRS